MKKNIKDLWVKALRSGEFKQTKYQLEIDGKYCALGVLAVLALVEGECSYDLKEDGGRYDGKKLSLSSCIMFWAGIALKDDKFLEEDAGIVKFVVDEKETSIAQLNDSEESFKEIAKYIEENWEKF